MAEIDRTETGESPTLYQAAQSRLERSRRRAERLERSIEQRRYPEKVLSIIKNYSQNGDISDLFRNRSLARQLVDGAVKDYVGRFYIGVHEGPIKDAYDNYQTLKSKAKYSPAKFHITKRMLAEEDMELAREMERHQEALDVLRPRNIFDVLRYPWVTRNRRSELEAKMQAVEAAREGLGRLKERYEDIAANAAEDHVRPIVRRIRATSAMLALQKRIEQDIHVAEHISSISRYTDETIIRPADVPRWSRPDGQMDWTKMRQAFVADSRNFRSDSYKSVQDAKWEIRRRKADADWRDYWRLESPEERAGFFERHVTPGVGISIEYDQHAVGGAEAMMVRFTDQATGGEILRSRVFYFNEEQKLGIESVFIPSKWRGQRGHGQFKGFMRGLVEMGEAQGVQRLELLAGEDSGPMVWARLAAKVSDLKVEVPLDMHGLNKDRYANWEGLVWSMRYRLRHIAEVDSRVGTPPELVEKMQTLLGADGEPLPPKENLYELARLDGRVGGYTPVESLLGGTFPTKYNAYWDFNDRVQLTNLKKAVGMMNQPSEPEPACERDGCSRVIQAHKLHW